MGLPVPLHEFDAFQWLKCADQNRGRNSFGLTNHIQHEVRAIVKENVGMTRREIHGANARRWAAVVMTGGIPRGIGFGFNDTAADSPRRQFVDDNFSDEEARQRDGVHRKFRTP